MRVRLYEILFVGNDRISRIVRLSLLILILANVAAVVMESVESLATQYRDVWTTFERISIVLFTLEYVARLWTCTVSQEYRGAFVGRLRYIFTPAAIIDLLAILPAYIPVLISADLRILRLLRLFRLLRVLKLTRYTQAVDRISSVLRAKRDELILVLVACGITLLLSASLLYWLEHDYQPDAFSSIPQSMWWAVSALTTVGYGDIIPITVLGKCCAAIIAIAGVGLFTLPAGILASGFISTSFNGKTKHCPHCGQDLGNID